jgi:cytochrome c-type biogenesis protein CcmE
MRRQFAIGSAIVALGVVALLIMGVRQSSSRHMTLDVLLVEAEQVIDRRIQLGGCTVVPGTIQWDEYRHRPKFQITDGENEIAVRYTGNAVLPDTFQDRAQVVIEGQFSSVDGRFDAEVVFAKCPSKYEGQNYEDHVEALDSTTQTAEPTGN